MLAFADGMFPLKISAVASSYHRADLPIAFVTTAGALTRWTFCLLVSTILVNTEQLEDLPFNFALLGATTYLTILALPQIVDNQIYVQELIFYRGNVDFPLSLFIAFVLPWALGSLVHTIGTVLTMACFYALTVGIMVSYAGPFVFYGEVIAEAQQFETNFRLSLK